MYLSSMISIKESRELNKKIVALKNEGKTIGFVPTMGALHPGHISLIKTAKQKSDIVVCSIFVNPTQFNNAADFEKYPITLDNDIHLLHQAGCDIVFLPTVNDIYADGTTNLNHYQLGFLETVYDGAFRPGHFQGVCNVVERLFRIVAPNHAFFGLKDYQQCMVISKLVSIMNWEEQLQLHFCDTLREANGLAMSSRNMRLSEKERQEAGIIYELLSYTKANITPANITTLQKNATEKLAQKGYTIDYFDIADAQDLAPITNWDGKQKIVCLVAVFVGQVRLIDNMRLN
jgi:pantoate--beta-alanine ligase